MTDDPIIGFRWWRVIDGDTRLHALYKTGWAWRTGTNEAACCSSRATSDGEERWVAAGKHISDVPLIPQVACSCGFHAHYTVARAASETFNRMGVIGAVALWGNVVLHETGLRAQFAHIVALTILPPFDQHANSRATVEEAAAAADHYGIPLVALSQLQAVASEHGTVLEDMVQRPHPTPAD